MKLWWHSGRRRPLPVGAPVQPRPKSLRTPPADRSNHSLMAPPHTQFNPRYDRNRDIAALSDIGYGYKRIARQTGLNPSTVCCLVKRYWERDHVHDTPIPDRPWKFTNEAAEKIVSVTQENPQASLKQLAEQLNNLHLTVGRTTIDRITKEAGFKLVVLRKKPWFQKKHKQRRLEWCHWKKGWSREDWRKIVWLDEAKVDYIAYQPGRKVRILPGEELLDKNLAPVFKLGRISVGCWAAFIHEKELHLFEFVNELRKRGSQRRTG
jgi:transposase